MEKLSNMKKICAPPERFRKIYSTIFNSLRKKWNTDFWKVNIYCLSKYREDVVKTVNEKDQIYILVDIDRRDDDCERKKDYTSICCFVGCYVYS